MFYLLLFCALVALRFSFSGRPRTRRQIYPVVLLVLFLFSAFRFEVGCDWSGYQNMFELQAASSLSEALRRSDPGWWTLMGLTHLGGLPYPWINVFSSAIFFAGIHVLARRQGDPLGFLVLLYPVLIINLPMSGIRQGAAIGLMCIAFTAFLDRRLIAFLLWTFAASLFHSSAAVFILLAPMVHGEYSASRIALAGFLAVPGAVALLTGSDAQLAVSRYVGTGVDSAGAIFRFGLLLATGLFFFVLVRGTWRKRFPQDFSLIALGALLMVGLFPLVFVSTVIGDRIAYYLVPLQAVIFSRFPYLGRRFHSLSMTFAPYLVLGFMLLVWTNNSWLFDRCYVPYQSWIFGFPHDVSSIER